jgi:hypothetical protein
MLEFFKNFGEKHEQLKKRIHKFRIPLPKWGQRVMGFVYFSLPVMFGYFIMNKTTDIAQQNLGVNGEKVKDERSYYDRSKIVAEQKKILQGVLDDARRKKEAEDRK